MLVIGLRYNTFQPFTRGSIAGVSLRRSLWLWAAYLKTRRVTAAVVVVLKKEVDC